MSAQIKLPKEYFSLAELSQRWGWDISDIFLQIGTGKLKAHIKIIGNYVPTKIIGKETAPLEDGESPENNDDVSEPDIDGLYMLPEEYIQHLITDKGVYLAYAHCDGGKKAIVIYPERLVTLDDVVITKQEVARFEMCAQILDDGSQINESEKSRLLRLVGVLALVLANKGGKYAIGTKPNVSQIAIDVETMLASPEVGKEESKSQSDIKFSFDKAGLGNTNIRLTISDGIKLLME